jgi:H+-translocating NAD(P) transhydrogenase subunit alpha
VIIGVVKEARRGETRVAATPATVEQLRKLGYEVVVESGAGLGSRFPDEAYVDAGA